MYVCSCVRALWCIAVENVKKIIGKYVEKYKKMSSIIYYFVYYKRRKNTALTNSNNSI